MLWMGGPASTLLSIPSQLSVCRKRSTSLNLSFFVVDQEVHLYVL